MPEQQVQLAPEAEEATRGAPSPSVRSLAQFRIRNPFTRGAARYEPPADIPEGLLRQTTYRRDAIYRRTLALADVTSSAVAVLIGVQVLGADTLNPVALLALPLVLLVGKLTGLYDRDEHVIRKTTLDEVPTLFWVASLYSLLIWVGGDLIVEGHFGRDQAVGVWALLFASMISTRTLARQLARRLSGEERCLVLGDAETAEWIRHRFDQAPGLKARVVRRVPLDPEPDANGGAAPNGRRFAGRDEAMNGDVPLEELLAADRIERAIIAPDGSISDDLLDTTRRLKSLGLRVSVLPRLPEVVGSSVVLDDIDGITVLGMRRFGLSRSSRVVKRCFDLVGAGLGLLVISPLLAAIAMAIKLDSRGPILFRQRRMGRDGVPFEMLKFRTMVDGAEERKVALAARNEADGGLFKIKDDPRITRVGGALRRFSLDELPQLVNVMRGEMALVGPRPLVLSEDSRIEGWRRSRLELPPGLTGPWQVFGSARIPLDEMVKIDYLYGANWSLWLDVKTLLRTIPFVLGRRGL
jgi:exopolysaccharide biosynthesis polyprenyl glycosylphosphotransferase